MALSAWAQAQARVDGARFDRGDCHANCRCIAPDRAWHLGIMVQGTGVIAPDRTCPRYADTLPQRDRWRRRWRHRRLGRRDARIDRGMRPLTAMGIAAGIDDGVDNNGRNRRRRPFRSGAQRAEKARYRHRWYECIHQTTPCTRTVFEYRRQILLCKACVTRFDRVRLLAYFPAMNC